MATNSGRAREIITLALPGGAPSWFQGFHAELVPKLQRLRQGADEASGRVLTSPTIVVTDTLALAFDGQTTGDLLVAVSAQAFDLLPDVAAGSYLRSGGPVWSTLTLPNSATMGDLLVATGANAIGSLADVATGQVLTSGGVGALPVYSANPSVTTLRVAGTQVVSTQGAAVPDATGGATIDTEARTALNTLLARLRVHGLIAT